MHREYLRKKLDRFLAIYISRFHKLFNYTYLSMIFKHIIYEIILILINNIRSLEEYYNLFQFATFNYGLEIFDAYVTSFSPASVRRV